MKFINFFGLFRSDGPFGKVNRPGYPTKIKFVGRLVHKELAQCLQYRK
jgi:hypothetical protein